MNKIIEKLELTEGIIVMKKELRAYFISPIAYIVITIFLVLTGFLFFKDFFYINQASMRVFFDWLPILLIFVTPAVTMRLFSEERHSGSLEILLTLPISTRNVVLGKLFAGTLFVALMLVPTLLYVVTIIIVGSPDYGPIIGSYLGVILLGGSYAAVGLLVSSITKNQIVAFIVGLFACAFLWLLGYIANYLPSALSSVEILGTGYHFKSIARGIIDSRDILYFVSVITISVLFTIKFLDERR